MFRIAPALSPPVDFVRVHCMSSDFENEITLLGFKKSPLLALSENEFHLVWLHILIKPPLTKAHLVLPKPANVRSFACIAIPLEGRTLL